MSTVMKKKGFWWKLLVEFSVVIWVWGIFGGKGVNMVFKFNLGGV